MPALSDITNSTTGTTRGSVASNTWSGVGWGSPILHPTEDWGNLNFIMPEPPSIQLKHTQANQLRVLGKLNDWLNKSTLLMAQANLVPTHASSPICWSRPTANNLDLLAQLVPLPDLFRVPPHMGLLFQSHQDILQCVGSPTLRWLQDEYDHNKAHTLEDLISWLEQAPPYRDNPCAGEHTLIPVCWDPYPVFEQ